MASSTSYTTNSEDRIRSNATNVAEKASDMARDAGVQIERAMDSASDIARRSAESSREAGERVQQVAGNMKRAVQKSLDEQPMTTLAMAAIIGFVVGALWKS